jgi:hypothetical protein
MKQKQKQEIETNKAKLDLAITEQRMLLEQLMKDFSYKEKVSTIIDCRLRDSRPNFRRNRRPCIGTKQKIKSIRDATRNSRRCLSPWSRSRPIL